MTSISNLESKLSKKQKKVSDANFDREVVRDVYNVSDDEIIDMIIQEIKNNEEVQNYMYTKTQIQAVEAELYLNATFDDTEAKSPIKQKAIDSFLDRVKGKATNRIDVKVDQKVTNISRDDVEDEVDTILGLK